MPAIRVTRDNIQITIDIEPSEPHQQEDPPHHHLLTSRRRATKAGRCGPARGRTSINSPVNRKEPQC
jgi:hypothetical protein